MKQKQTKKRNKKTNENENMKQKEENPEFKNLAVKGKDVVRADYSIQRSGKIPCVFVYWR